LKNYYKTTQTSLDNEVVHLLISDPSVATAANTVSGFVMITGVCVSSSVAANIGKNYTKTVYFLLKNDTPFTLVDSSDGFIGCADSFPKLAADTSDIVCAMLEGEANITVEVQGVIYTGATDNQFVWTASFYINYIEV
jgi:hypothetical protein